MNTDKQVWAHHPRGGVVFGYPSEPYPGLYGTEISIATTKEAAAARGGMSFPAIQVNGGPPPPGAEVW